jgi:hypothetical protein
MPGRIRKALNLAALAIAAAVAVEEYSSWQIARRQMIQLAHESGVARQAPEVVQDIAREPDLESVRLRTARALLAHELDRSWMIDLSPPQRAEMERLGLDNLARARDIAARALDKRPSSWQAAMVLGGSTYLSLFRTNDPKVAIEPSRWRNPLELAQRLGPGQQEPLRLLSAAYLSQWPRLTAQERGDVVNVLKTAFSDPETANLLLPRWIQLASSLDQAYEIVPDTAEAWWTLQVIYAAKRDWERYCDARSRWDRALKRKLAVRVERAADLVASGDLAGARLVLQEVLIKLPIEGRHAGLLTRLVEILPPGPVGLAHARKFREWLTWARSRCLLDTCPLPRKTIRRMGGLAEFSRVQQAAEIALMAGDLPQAELYERRWALPRSQAWSNFYLLKAHLLMQRGDIDGARSSLASISTETRRSAASWSTARLVDPEHPIARATSTQTSWPASAWIRGQSSNRIELVVAEEADGLEIAIAAGSSDGSAIQISWDGSHLEFVPVWQRQTVRLDLRIEPGAHILEIETLKGPRVDSGAVRLRLADA